MMGGGPVCSVAFLRRSPSRVSDKAFLSIIRFL